MFIGGGVLISVVYLGTWIGRRRQSSEPENYLGQTLTLAPGAWRKNGCSPPIHDPVRRGLWGSYSACAEITGVLPVTWGTCGNESRTMSLAVVKSYCARQHHATCIMDHRITSCCIAQHGARLRSCRSALWYVAMHRAALKDATWPHPILRSVISYPATYHHAMQHHKTIHYTGLGKHRSASGQVQCHAMYLNHYG